MKKRASPKAPREPDPQAAAAASAGAQAAEAQAASGPGPDQPPVAVSTDEPAAPAPPTAVPARADRPPSGRDATGPDATGPETTGQEATQEEPAGQDPSYPDAPPEDKPRRRRGSDVVPPPPERLDGAIEAMLLAAGDVLTAERLRDLLGLASAIHVREALARVRERWSAAGLSVELEDVAGGVRVVTRPEYAEYVRRLSRVSAGDPRLSQGQLETLSIVAYRQPVARAEIERIRGVQVGDALRALLERRLVKVVGRSEQPGRPLLYGTTTRFLTAFGLNDLKDLPSAKELNRL